ncbi:MAG TPA: MBL fold metallo-hydrolase [Xanthobacteraceae bacterium]|jgi:glyoxylase-like metal-dependent hydrolase (beta-lactamase superfamily II)|nr:MBL fold metallo-hydrolase [Xanthobacteraceae bacterium]
MTTFKVGDLTVHRVIEQERPFIAARDMLPGLSDEVLAENRDWLIKAGALEAGTDQMILCFQSYVVRTPHHVVLIDSCIGNDKNRAARPAWHMKTDDTWMRSLASHGLSVDDIDVVMCTHLHADHVGWNTRLENGRWVPTFPKARYLFSARELAFWEGQNAKTPVPAVVDSVLPIVAAGRAELVTSDHALDDHIRLMPTPGHTPDHFAVRLGRNGNEAVVTGDLIHSPLQVRYPELSPKFDLDPQHAAKTRRNFFEGLCDTPTLCCTAHFPSPSVGKIKRWGDGFRCEGVR